MAIPRTRPFQSLQTQRGNPQLQQLLQLIAQQSQRRPASGPPTALPAPFRQGITRSPLPPARVNPLNALDQAQRGAIPPGLLPGLPAGPQFVPGSEANVKGNFQSPNRAPGSVFSDITAGGVGPGTPGIPSTGGALPGGIGNLFKQFQQAAPLMGGDSATSRALAPRNPAAVGQRAGPSPAAGAAAARGLQGFQLPGQSLLRAGEIASRKSGEDIAGSAKDPVSKDQAKKTQDLSKRVAGVPKSAKNAPAWALPLMMMGLTMAASKRTDTLGAFSEGGLAGLQLFMQQKSTKRKAATEERKLRATEEKARATTTTARASTVTAEAAKIRAETGGKGTRGPVGKRFDDLQRILQSPGGAKLKRFFPDKKFAEVVGGMDDQEFELVKAGFSQLAAGVTFGEEITAEKVNQILEGARLATRREPGPAAVTGSRRTIGPEGIR